MAITKNIGKNTLGDKNKMTVFFFDKQKTAYEMPK